MLVRLWTRLSLLGRVLLSASLALVVAGNLLLVVSTARDSAFARNQMEENFASELDALMLAVGEPAVIGDYASIEQILRQHVLRSDVRRVAWIPRKGEAIAAVDSDRALAAPAWFIHLAGVPAPRGTRDLVVGGRTYGAIELEMTAIPVQNRLWDAFLSHLGILALALGMDFLGILLVLKGGLRPLAALTRAANDLAGGDYGRRIPLQGSPEISRVVVAFNAMADAVAAAQGALHDEAERLSVTLSSIGDGVIATGTDGRVEFMNPVAETLTGWTSAEAVGRPVDQVFVVVDEGRRERIECPVARTLGEGAAAASGRRMLLVARDGSERPIGESAAPIRHADGRSHGAVLVFRDQSEARRAIEGLKLSASVVEHSVSGVVITDPQQRIVDVNPSFTRITGYSREEAIGQTPRLLSSGRHDAGFFAEMWRGIERDGHWQGELWNRNKNGEIYPELLSVVAVRNDDGAVMNYVGMFTDIRELKAHEARLAHLAHHDPLTGLPNRVLLSDRIDVALAQATRSGRKLAVCYLDLDEFKPVNDTHGHAAGDRLLTEAAHRMQGALRGGDTVARMGGDEFVLLLAGLADQAECEAALLRVQECLAVPFLVGEKPVTVSASIGVTLYPDDQADADTLLRHADHALYAAKEAGRARWLFFDPVQGYASRHYRDFLGRLEQALAEGELRLYYQPKVNMRSGRVVGMEALIRWQHPERGLVPPGDFLPQIEGSGLEIAIGEWVVETALAQLDAWRDGGLHLTVSANIAPHHLAQAGFAERLQGLLAGHPELPPGRLELEVVESAALADLDHAGRVIDECRRLGVSFALDDFGTGYAMFTWLRNLAADTLKIDRSFVNTMLDDAGDRSIVAGIVGLGRAFNLLVVAEGVETPEHGAALLGLGCELAQGYAIARPMPAHEVPGWVAAWRPFPAWCNVEDRGAPVRAQAAARAG